MFSEFNSWLFYLLSLGLSSYLLGVTPEVQKRKTFLSTLLVLSAYAIPIIIGAYHVCGTDTLRYMQNYFLIRRIPKEELFTGLTLFSELGHRVLTKFLGYFNNVRVYLGVYSALTIIFMHKANQKFNPEAIAMVSYIFFIQSFLSSFNGMRQTLATVIIAYSFVYVFKKDFPKFLFFVLLASSFHLSAFIMIFTYFIWTKNEKLLHWPILMIILVVIASMSIGLTDFLGLFSEMEFETEKLQSYVGFGKYSGKEEFNNYSFYLNLLVGVIFAIHHTRLVKVNKKNSLFAFLYYISVAIGFSGFINPYAKRIGWYFRIPSVWLLADLPNCYNDHHSKWTARLLVLLYVILRFTITSYILGQSDIIPYIWILPYWART
ncbi:MAG: EpsG family protein [Clostridia bacterium]|nr:EpsG family protein [Clostridia bacterium]MBR6523967.1 EpsG family protein [Clostridia bacterium]